MLDGKRNLLIVPSLLATAITLMPRLSAFAEDPDTVIDTGSTTVANSAGQSAQSVFVMLRDKSPGQRKAWAAAGGESKPDGSGGGAEESNCYYRASTDRLSLQVYDKTPKDGFVLILMCGGVLELGRFGDQAPERREIWSAEDSAYVAYEDPDPQLPPPRPAQPQDFLDEAMGQLNLPAPSIGIGPDAQDAVVNLPLSFWVYGENEYQTTAGLAGGVGVVVTAKMRSVTWNFGEPASTTVPSGPAATLTCDGAGVPVSDGTTATADDARCVHQFRWKSTPERTGGAGAWTIGASVQWDVTWTSTGVNPAVTGRVDVAPTTNTTTLEVLEYRTRLIDNPDIKPGN